MHNKQNPPQPHPQIRQ